MTELIWDGKYDKDGRRVAPLRVALPFQTVETVNESARERQRALDLFGGGQDPEWRNRLIWGDKKYVLPSLLPEFAGKVDLVYIDPPFDTGADFSFQVQVDGEGFTKEPSVIEQKAYRDTWGRGLESYLQWFFETTVMLRELLANSGSMYVHLDWHVSHYAKCVLDEVFGSDALINEIIWRRKGGSALGAMNRLSTATDTILLYRKSELYTFNALCEMPSEEYIAQNFNRMDRDGRRFQPTVMRSPSPRPNLMYDYKGYKMPPNGWSVPVEMMRRLDEQGYLYFPEDKSRQIYKKIYLDEYKGQPINNLWADIATLKGRNQEILSYPTQKPEALLSRIIGLSSNEGDLVLDCFCGAGTTAAVAEKLGRRWIAADLGRFAIHTTRKRLLSIDNVKPFVVQNLGKYERQAWAGGEFGAEVEARTLAYRRFILDLYRARPLQGYAWLHGLKSGRMVHVGSVDAPVSPGDVTQIAMEFRRAIGTGADAPTTNGVDVLGWDFAFELNEVARQQAALAKIDVRFVRIPREVLEKRAVEQGDVRFFELAALGVDVAQKGRTVTLTLADFVIPLDDVPADVQSAIKHWAQWVDYWAVDWDNKEDTFHNQWQAYRTRKSRELQKSVGHTYDEPGTYRVVVKVVDILGNDTTKTLSVEVV